MPGITIGNHCLVAADSTVNSDCKDYSFITGNPAKHIIDIRKLAMFTPSFKHYPWPHHFERGMPWEGIGYENWLKTK